MANNSSDRSEGNNIALPEDVIIVLPVRDLVLFPGVAAPLTVSRARSHAALDEARASGRNVGVLLQHDPSVDTPNAADLHRVGTVAHILRHGGDERQQQLLVQGRQRFRVLDFLDGFPFLVARIAPIHEPELNTPALEARHRVLQKQAVEALQLLPQVRALRPSWVRASPSLLVQTHPSLSVQAQLSPNRRQPDHP